MRARPSPSRIATAYTWPSTTGTVSASTTFTLSGLISTTHTTPVYASDPALPRRPQDSVPTCPLRLWSDKTSTCKSSSVSPTHSRSLLKFEGGGSAGPDQKIGVLDPKGTANERDCQ